MPIKELTPRALPEVPLGGVIKGLLQGYDGGTLDCLANERLGGVKYPGLAGLWSPALRDFPPD